MFKFLYELFGKNADPIYVSDVYPTVGLFTLLLSLVIVFVFYVMLGRWQPVWHKVSHWIITLIIILGVNFYFAIVQAKGSVGGSSYDSYMIKFGLINMLYTFLYFIIFSIIFKKLSIFAKHTPF